MTQVLGDKDVVALLPMRECIDAMETAYRDFAGGGAVNIPRIRYRSETSDPNVIYGSNIHIGTTPSYDAAAIRIGGSAGSPDPGARGAQAPKHANRNWGFVCLIDMRTGELQAIIQEFALSGIRVRSSSFLAAK